MFANSLISPAAQLIYSFFINTWIWYCCNKIWKSSLENIMIEYRDFRRSYQSNSSQLKAYEKYYYANLVLVECLNECSRADPTIKKNIREALFLPVNHT